MITDAITYGWSTDGRTRYFHSVIRGRWHARTLQIKCDGGYHDFRHSAERHAVPTHLKPCPKCFREAGA